MPVLVGTEALDQLVPAHYQASVFPAFGAMAALLAADLLRGVHRASWLARVALLGCTSALSVVRLAGVLPLSGHMLFLAALLAHEVATRGRSGHVLLWVCALPSLALTTWYKLFVWHDATWFFVSLAVGAALGAACRLLWRNRFESA